MRGLNTRYAWGLLLLALATPASCQDGVPQMAPMNPEFEAFVNRRGVQEAASEEGWGLGYIPGPVDLSHLKGSNVFRAPAQGYPSSFDLRTLGKVTPVGNQGSCGSCWAFATFGSMESWLKPGETWDFSENNLKNLSGFDIACCDGGEQFMATAYLARWSGPVIEADDPHDSSNCASPPGLDVHKHLQRAMFIPDRAGPLDNDSIKHAVMNYGAVFTSFYINGSYYNSSNASYYCPAGAVANHAVCIVGWDDSYPRSRFLTHPLGDGAFIAKNSWGTGWGQSGYFHVSYYDANFGRDNVLFTAEPTSSYTRVYQYDQLGWVGSFGYGAQSAGFANVFTAVSAESLAAVSFYTARPSSTYTLKIYLDPTSGPVNTSGPVLTQSGTIEIPGYSTVALSPAVQLTQGRRFSVVVWLTTPGYSYPVAVEYPTPYYSSGATSTLGQSFVSSNGTSWADFYGYKANGNVCLKAFARQGPALAVTPESGLTSSGTCGGPFSPCQAYTVTNTGVGSLDWNARGSEAWISASPASGTLYAGESADVTVSVNSQANLLPAGSYEGVVTFTNSTNGIGTTTREVHLEVANVSIPAMSVTPTEGLAAWGPPGGPFTPGSLAYTVANTSDTDIDFSVTHNLGDNWITVSHLLPAHLATQVTASFGSLALALAPGTYTDTMVFTNLTNGQGNTSRQIQLTVLGGRLDVAPAGGLVSSGNQGGPFSPSQMQYTLSNPGNLAIDWSITHSSSANWLSVSPGSGTLAGGAIATVTLSVNSGASLLPAGSYSDTVVFTNNTNGAGSTTRPAKLTVTNKTLTGIEVTPASLDCPSNDPRQLHAVARFSDGSTQDVTSSAQWSSSASSTVTVSPSGVVTPSKAGSATITCAYTDGGVTRSDTCAVTIKYRSLYYLYLSPPAYTFYQPGAAQFTCRARVSDGWITVTDVCDWTSSDPSVATVDFAGLVTPHKNGVASIRAGYLYNGVVKHAQGTVQVMGL